ncbi:MAG TPA: ABC transporter permease [Planctomycetota bacterium]|nr:ABC transporter permease [Planctomycetota bacterium]
MLVPLSYNLRSLWVRRSATLLTVFGIASTVAVVSGVLALQQGFRSLYASNGRDDVAVFLRPGATNEGDSAFRRDLGLQLIKNVPEIAVGENGAPLASMECYLAVRRFRMGGDGTQETNVPIRGVQPATFAIRGDDFRVVEGRRFEPGTDEIMVGVTLVDRIRNCQLGDVLTLNTTPFKVVGVFECDGPFESEIWGDLDRMLAALERYGPNRVIARMRPEAYQPASDPATLSYDTRLGALAERLKNDREVPAKVWTEREFLSAQTGMLSAVLIFLGTFLGLVMGIAAVFTATNTMLSAIAARTHEIGILKATGFRPFAILLSFLFEACVLGLAGGVLGGLASFAVNGVQTGTTNFQTFTEVSFAFRVTPVVLATAIGFSLLLGLFGGLIPAWSAARMTPTEALRRR